MEINGTIYCDECHLAIQKQVHVRLPRPQIAGKVHDAFAHFHNREAGDCWTKVKNKATQRAAERRPTAFDMSQYHKWLAQQEAKKRVVAHA